MIDRLAHLQKRNWISFVLWLGLALLVVPVAHAEPDNIKIVIGDTDHPPYYFKKGDDITGLAFDVLDTIQDDIAVTYDVRRRPWTRMLQEMLDGEHDIALVMYQTPQRTRQYYFLEPAYASEDVVFVCRRPCNVRFNGKLESMSEHFITTVRNYSYGDVFNDADFLKKDIVETEELLFSQLLRGKISLAVTSPPRFRHDPDYVRINDRFEMLSPPIDQEPIYFVASLKMLQTEAFRTFHQAYKRALQSPTYRQSLTKYQLD